jgi:hypothetical protein
LLSCKQVSPGRSVTTTQWSLRLFRKPCYHPLAIQWQSTSSRLRLSRMSFLEEIHQCLQMCRKPFHGHRNLRTPKHEIDTTDISSSIGRAGELEK